MCVAERSSYMICCVPFRLMLSFFRPMGSTRQSKTTPSRNRSVGWSAASISSSVPWRSATFFSSLMRFRTRLLSNSKYEV